MVTEVVDTRDVSWVGEYAGVLQIGARNMQNLSLLRQAGGSGKPILLKRGMHSTLEEWLNCAEYIPAVKTESHLPVFVDPPSALSDKDQQLTPAAFAALTGKLRRLKSFMDELG